MLSYFALYGTVFMLGILILLLQKKKKLTTQQIQQYKKYLKQSATIQSPSEQIIYLDKLYHKILKGYGYSGTFGEILKGKPKVIPNIQNIWDLHKIRNTLVHDFANIPETQLQKKSQAYKKEISQLLK